MSQSITKDFRTSVGRFDLRSTAIIMLFLHFYKSLALPLLSVSFFTWLLAGHPGYDDPMVSVFCLHWFWVKLFTTSILIYLFREFRRDKLYFYNHFGISEIRLYISTFFLDLLAFLILIGCFTAISIF